MMRRPNAPPILPPAGPVTSSSKPTPSFARPTLTRPAASRPPVPGRPGTSGGGHPVTHGGGGEPNYAARKAKKRAANGGVSEAVTSLASTAGDQANAIKKIPRLRGKAGME